MYCCRIIISTVLLALHVIACPPTAWILSAYDICFWTTTTRNSVADSDMLCKADNGQLAVIPSADINADLFALHGNDIGNADSTYGAGAGVWISVTDKVLEDQFTTWDGDALTFEFWRSGQPNDDVDPEEQDCVRIRKSDSFRWADKGCDNLLIALCSASMTTTNVPPTTTSQPTTTTTLPTTSTTSQTTITTTPTTTTAPPTTTTAPPTTTTAPPTTTTAPPTTTTAPPTTTTAPPTTTTTPQPTTTPEESTTDNLNVCSCPGDNVSKNYTGNMDTMLENMINTLIVDAKKTSAYKRTLTSASDPRPSAKAIGLTAVAMMVVPFGLVIMPDIFMAIRVTVNLIKR
ncbi:glycoprotein gp100-like [Pecten maximus]|uniref:glycoprotein gp100-like n=1 Tax=Pecten maximus TaxID=6579 RepID=UPI001458AEAE|nr:glycoprotein gp100-like [Pecten maximus]